MKGRVCDLVGRCWALCHCGLVCTTIYPTNSSSHGGSSLLRTDLRSSLYLFRSYLEALFNAAIHTIGMRVERTLAWEDTCKRLLLRFERMQQQHDGMKLLGYTMLNLRTFCSA